VGESGGSASDDGLDDPAAGDEDDQFANVGDVEADPVKWAPGGRRGWDVGFGGVARVDVCQVEDRVFRDLIERRGGAGGEGMILSYGEHPLVDAYDGPKDDLRLVERQPGNHQFDLAASKGAEPVAKRQLDGLNTAAWVFNLEGLDDGKERRVHRRC
jgi:hypothetical protein